MRIGIPKEIKDHEFRVGMTPEGVRALCRQGHTVWVQSGAGEGSGYPDVAYEAAGARIAKSLEEVYRASDLIVKVKEPLPPEYPLLREGQILMTFLHLAANPTLARVLVERGVSAIAYETVEEGGRLPLLIPMSEVAGRLSVLLGAYYLQRTQGGRGVLLGGIPGVLPARVLVLGCGTVGRNAIQMAVGLGAQVVALNRWLPPMRELDALYRGRVLFRLLEDAVVEEEALQADLVIGAVLIPGGRAPYLIRKETVSRMKPGSVIVDVSIDQGGCVETSRPTTHSHPVYEVDGVLHYCVPNIPAAVPRTATQALANVTLPYILRVAREGLERAVDAWPALARGLNVHQGRIVHPEVARALDREGAPSPSD